MTQDRFRRLLPLVFATMATQASIVVLAPLIVAIGDDLGASVSAIGIARSVLAGTAFAGSLVIGPLIDRIGVRPLIVRGATLALAGAGLTAAAPSLPVFYAAHVITGMGVACLLSAGFAGVASQFERGDATWAMGYVVGAQSLSWILGNPIVGLLADAGSWRLAYVVPATICFAALLAGLALKPAPGMVAARDEPDSIRDGLRAVFGDRSARRWTIAELVGYSAWTAELTYAAAFYIREYGVSETTVGLLLAAGSLVFLATSLNVARLTARFPRKPLLVAAGIGMGAMFMPFFNWAPAVAVSFSFFAVMAVFAGIRSAGSSALGLDQLPDRPGAMMGARTASAQLGYMIGAAGGGLVLALWGFSALGFVLFAGMAASASLLAGVRDPWTERQRASAGVPAPLTD
jgi:predicted MFS family arabinose efflux permease